MYSYHLKFNYPQWHSILCQGMFYFSDINALVCFVIKDHSDFIFFLYEIIFSSFLTTHSLILYFSYLFFFLFYHSQWMILFCLLCSKTSFLALRTVSFLPPALALPSLGEWALLLSQNQYTHLCSCSSLSMKRSRTFRIHHYDTVGKMGDYFSIPIL